MKICEQTLGQTAYHLAQAGLNGYLATVSNLKQDVSQWRCGGAPLTVSMDPRIPDLLLSILFLFHSKVANCCDHTVQNIKRLTELTEFAYLLTNICNVSLYAITGNDVSQEVATWSWCFSNWQACCA